MATPCAPIRPRGGRRRSSDGGAASGCGIAVLRRGRAGAGRAVRSGLEQRARAAARGEGASGGLGSRTGTKKHGISTISSVIEEIIQFQPPALGWVSTPCSGCPGPHTWLWASPGMRHPQLHWAAVPGSPCSLSEEFLPRI